MPAPTMSHPTTSHSIAPDARGVRRVEFRALGTTCVIQFIQADEQEALRFLADALTWLEVFEKRFSRYIPQSDISVINAAAGKEWVKVDQDMDYMLDLAGELHDMSGGIIDPCMLPLLKVWDWKAAHARLPEAEEVEAARLLTGWGQVERKPGSIFLPRVGMGLDFGGFGKEFAVDHLVRIARDRGIRDALIDLGQDVFAMGGNGKHSFWHVGIQDGRSPGNQIGGLAVSNHAVSSSGDHTRSFEHDGVRYGHILDPRTGWPVRNGMRLATALASSCLQAGVASTTAFVLGRKDGLSFATGAQDVEVCVQDDGGTEGTPGFIRHQVTEF